MPRFTRVAVLIAVAVVAVGVVAAASGRYSGVPTPKGYSGVEASLPIAYKSGIVSSGAQLAKLPIIDLRGQRDAPHPAARRGCTGESLRLQGPCARRPDDA